MPSIIANEIDVRILSILVKKGETLIGDEFTSEEYNSLIEKLKKCRLYDDNLIKS